MCLNTVNGSIPDDVLVKSADASRQLKDGISIYGVAHPSGGDRNGHYAVLVNLDTGKWPRSAPIATRRPTRPRSISLEGTGALAAKDPVGEEPKYNLQRRRRRAHGRRALLRLRRGAAPSVIDTAGGGHASYGYPGATKIQGLGGVEASIIRDGHNGQGAKLFGHESAYLTDFPAGGSSACVGQWGCTLAPIPRSSWAPGQRPPLPPLAHERLGRRSAVCEVEREHLPTALDGQRFT